jgi:hypothetical protein
VKASEVQSFFSERSMSRQKLCKIEAKKDFGDEVESHFSSFHDWFSQPRVMAQKIGPMLETMLV